ncbi:MAG: hypothetical protein P4L66_12555 [Acetobacteraceae bacterium]|nr:hypothetical protein [Acetobacteraceae bacterium]
MIQQAEVRAEKAEDNVEKARKSVHELDAESRRWIAKLIITGFLAAIGGVILLLALLASLGIPDARWNTFADKTLEILKNVLLPVVTLILGYYFGQSSKSGD